MEICYKGGSDPAHTSCCTRKMERKFHVAATKEFADTVQQSSAALKTMLEQRAAELQGTCFGGGVLGCFKEF
jgi:hypothetical protein